MNPLEAHVWIAPCDNGYLLSYREFSEIGAGFGRQRQRFFLDKGELLAFLSDHWPSANSPDPADRE